MVFLCFQLGVALNITIRQELILQLYQVVRF